LAITFSSKRILLSMKDLLFRKKREKKLGILWVYSADRMCGGICYLSVGNAASPPPHYLDHYLFSPSRVRQGPRRPDTEAKAWGKREVRGGGKEEISPMENYPAAPPIRRIRFVNR
jgi:hypothetical protein